MGGDALAAPERAQAGLRRRSDSTRRIQTQVVLAVTTDVPDRKVLRRDNAGDDRWSVQVRRDGLKGHGVL